MTKVVISESDVSPPGGPEPDRLSSWKEIASYLGVSVRRAQQWETELGLPVERLATGRRARISARRADIDRWRRERTATAPAVLPPLASSETPERDAATPRFPDDAQHSGARPATNRTWRLAVPVVAALPFAVACWFAWSALRPASREPASAGIVNGDLHVLNSRGALLWRVGFPEGTARSPAVALPPEKVGVTWRTNTTLVRDVDGDGRTEVLFVLSTTMGNGAVFGDRLICYNADGTERWRVTPGRRTRWQDRQFDAAYSIWWVVGPFPVDGRAYLLVSASNAFFPCQVSLLDAATGRLVGEYWHFGALLSGVVLDVNGDGRLEAIVGGVNNPGPGNGAPALVVLDLPLPVPRPKVASVFDPPREQEARYLLFPPVDAFALDPYPAAVTWIRTNDGNTLELAVSLGHNYPSKGQVYYSLDSHLSVTDARPCDLLKAYHEGLRRAAQLDHSLNEREMQGWRELRRFDTMPNANSPAVVSAWEASRATALRQTTAPRR